MMIHDSLKYLFLFSALLLFSCKKDYTCECSTLISTQAPLGNTETYHVKEKTERDVLINCSEQYTASGKATGGVYCDIKKGK